MHSISTFHAFAFSGFDLEVLVAAAMYIDFIWIVFVDFF